MQESFNLSIKTAKPLLIFKGVCYNKSMNDIICAISTPLGRGAISIVRMSGKGCKEVASKVFSCKEDFANLKPRHLYLGLFDLGDETKERCLMAFFAGPFSYTGEDMIEFQLHGGSLLTQKVLSKLINIGARLAEPGEFTKRAFENGKVSLDEAESIIGEINAESEGELKATLGQAEGKLKKKIRALQESLTESIAEIEATLDYPEEDFEKSAKDKIFKNLERVKLDIDQFLEDSKNARYVSNGISVAIVGSPNVGKSSLLNALLGQDRAIVTDVAGTTRDVLNESINYRGIKINFVDTAGIRESDDKVEKIGIERSKKALDEADEILFVLDGSREESEQDKEIKALLDGKKNVIIVVNKADQKRVLPYQQGEIEISALKEENINTLKDKIYSQVINEEIDYSRLVVINERQISALEECESVLKEIEISRNESMDIIAMLIKRLWNNLGKITGESENEQIIDLIFSKFCLGK